MLYMPFDTLYLVLVLPAMIFAMWAQHRVTSSFKKHSKQRTSSGITGAEAAREVLRQNGVTGVKIEMVKGNLTDHFDPRTKTIRLSENVYGTPSVAAVGVAAHEAGHAAQYASAYAPMKIRAAIIPITTFGSNMAMPLVILGLVLGMTGLINIGIFLFGAVVVFKLVTLPVENFMRFIFAMFIGSIVYVVVRIILAPAVAPPSDIAVRVKSDYIFTLLQSLFGAAAMLLPGYLRRKVKLNIPTAMMIAYAGFLYLGIYLAEVRSFYERIPHWDTFLHALSGMALGALGFSIVSLLNDSESVVFSLSPLFVAIFAFCFALALGVVWEIYEFTIDYFFHTNTQAYALESGEPLIGQAALVDTMKDLIVDAIGALAVSVVGYISLKHNKGLMDRLQVKKAEG